MNQYPNSNSHLLKALIMNKQEKNTEATKLNDQLNQLADNISNDLISDVTSLVTDMIKSNDLTASEMKKVCKSLILKRIVKNLNNECEQ